MFAECFEARRGFITITFQLALENAIRKVQVIQDGWVNRRVLVIKSKRMRWAGHVARMGIGEACTGFRWET
jgi:hypothetical protein